MSTARGWPSSRQSPASGTRACSKSGSSGSDDARRRLDRDVGADDRREARAGERTPPSSPIRTVAQPPSSSSRGSARCESKAGCRLAARLGQRDPELHAAQAPGVRRRRLLGVRDPAPGRHQVQHAGRRDRLRGRGCRGGRPRPRAATRRSAGRCAGAAPRPSACRTRRSAGRTSRGSTRARPGGAGCAAAAAGWRGRRDP